MFEIGAMLNNLERDRIQAWAVAAQMGFRVVHTSALPEAWLQSRIDSNKALPLTPDPSPLRREGSQSSPLSPQGRGVGGEGFDSTVSNDDLALYVNAARASGLTIHSMFIGFDGQSYADPASAARTVGLAVPSLRAHRLAVALAYPGVAQQLGAVSLSTHLGHLPPTSEADYADLLTTIRDLAAAGAVHGQTLHLETGQEPATVLLRFLIDVDRPNVGVNFDPANFVLYGSDDPLNAVQLLGPWVRGVHCKDALPPTASGKLGTDVSLGQGVVDFPGLLKRLLAFGYRGPWIIEREHGPDVRDDFVRGRAYLETLFRTELAGNY